MKSENFCARICSESSPPCSFYFQRETIKIRLREIRLREIRVRFETMKTQRAKEFTDNYDRARIGRNCEISSTNITDTSNNGLALRHAGISAMNFWSLHRITQKGKLTGHDKRRAGQRRKERWKGERRERGYKWDCEFVRASKKGERKNARGFTLMYRLRWVRKRKDREKERG